MFPSYHHTVEMYRQILAYCFYKRRPSIPPNPYASTEAEHRGWRAEQKSIQLSPETKVEIKDLRSRQGRGISSTPVKEKDVNFNRKLEIEIKVPGVQKVLYASLPVPSREGLNNTDFSIVQFGAPISILGWD